MQLFINETYIYINQKKNTENYFLFPFILSFSFTFYFSSLFNVSSFRVFVQWKFLNSNKEEIACRWEESNMWRICFFICAFYIIFDFVLASNCEFTWGFFVNCVSASNTMWSNLEHVWNRWLSRMVISDHSSKFATWQETHPTE